MSQTCNRCNRIVPRACQSDDETLECDNLLRTQISDEKIDAELAEYHAFLKTKPSVRILITDENGQLLERIVAYKTTDAQPLNRFADDIADLIERNFETIET